MSVRLFILGILKQHSAHGYEIKKRLHDLGVENWANLNWSSVYHALKQMEKEGLIQKYKILDNNGRPAKDVYTIQPEGEYAFSYLLKKTCIKVTIDKNPIYIALLYLHELPPEEKVALLQQRLETLWSFQYQVQQKRVALQSESNVTEEMLFSLDRDIAQRSADITWTENLIKHYTKNH